MITWTTANIPLSVPIDITAAKIKATIAQPGVTITKDISGAVYANSKTTFTLSLTQTETGRFKAGKARIMANWIFQDEQRDGSAIGEITVQENLLPEEISYD